MLVCAHRGFHRVHAENSLDAFEAAVTLGADAIETDVRLTADGVAVLFHDRLIDSRDVADMTWRELSTAAGFHVPALTEAIALWDSVLWVVEIKAPRALPAVADVVAKYHSSRRMLVISFWHTLIEYLLHNMDVDCGLSLAHRPLTAALPDPVEHLHSERFQTLIWNYEYVDQDLLRSAADRGFRNWLYNVQSAADHRHCQELCPAGIITDHPEQLLTTPQTL